MITSLRRLGIFWAVTMATMAVNAQLLVEVSPPKVTGAKAVVKLAMKNTLPQKIESARASVFLTDEQGKMVGQAVRWVIGDPKAREALAPRQETTFHFVVPLQRLSLSTNLQARVNLSRVILEGGKLLDVNRDVQVQAKVR